MLIGIAYYQILGHSLVTYLGFLTVFMFSLTAFVAISNKRGLHIIPFKYHSKIAILAILIGLTHGLLIALSD